MKNPRYLNILDMRADEEGRISHVEDIGFKKLEKYTPYILLQ